MILKVPGLRLLVSGFRLLIDDSGYFLTVQILTTDGSLLLKNVFLPIKLACLPAKGGGLLVKNVLLPVMYGRATKEKLSGSDGKRGCSD